MPNRVSRRTKVRALAAANLLFWVIVAVVVGLLASDAVDLGVESLARQYQATGVAVWDRAASGDRRPAAPPTLVADAPQPPTTDGSASTDLLAAPESEPRSTGAALEQPIGPEVESGAPTPPPPQPLVSKPLLVADPALSTFGEVNTEMNRSEVGRPVQIRYQEAALNREINALLRSKEDLPYHDVEVDLRRGRVSLTGAITLLGIDIDTQTQGTVTAVSCLPEIEIHSISIGVVLTPDFIKDSIRRTLLEAMTWYPEDYTLCLDQIVIEDGRVTIYGHRR